MECDNRFNSMRTNFLVLTDFMEHACDLCFLPQNSSFHYDMLQLTQMKNSFLDTDSQNPLESVKAILFVS